ncbi:MAG: hypothetical protein ACO331_13815 [Prochlorothrix sp.]
MGTRGIQHHIKAKHGKTVKNCWIAHAKELLNLPKRPRQTVQPRVHPCPAWALPLIQDAFLQLYDPKPTETP